MIKKWVFLHLFLFGVIRCGIFENSTTSSTLATNTSTSTSTSIVDRDWNESENVILTDFEIEKEIGDLEIEAKIFFKEIKANYSDKCLKYQLAKLNFLTNSSRNNEFQNVQRDLYEFLSKISRKIEDKFKNWQKFQDPHIKKLIKQYILYGPGKMNQRDFEKMNNLYILMEMAHLKSPNLDKCNTSLLCNLSISISDLREKIEMSNEFNESLYYEYWQIWQKSTTNSVSAVNYTQFINYQNLMASSNGYKNIAELQYDIRNEKNGKNFTIEMEKFAKFWSELKPYYSMIHAYVRMKLRQENNKFSSEIKKFGYLPAHLFLLKNDWTHLDNLTKPCGNIKSITELLKKNFSETDKWFESVAERSRNTICKNFFCAVSDSDELHNCESNSIQSSLNLSFNGPSGFLYTSDALLGGDIENSRENISETDINYLYFMALLKFVQLPYAFSAHMWKLRVIEGKVKSEDFNQIWWEILRETEGVSPPSGKLDDAFIHFDPHIIFSDNFYGEFLDTLIEFNVFEALCIKTRQYGSNNPFLYQCDLSRDLDDLKMTKSAEKIYHDIKVSGDISTESILKFFEPLFEKLDEELRNSGESPCFGSDCEIFAKDYLQNFYEFSSSEHCTNYSNARWDYQHDLTNISLRNSSLEVAKFWTNFRKIEFSANISQFDFEAFNQSGHIYRQFKYLNQMGASKLSSKKFDELSMTLMEMSNIYGQAKICPYDNQSCNLTTNGLELDNDISDILAKIGDYDEMSYIWDSWRLATGSKVRPLFSKYVQLSNEDSRANGFKSLADSWISKYESDTFAKDVEKIWDSDVRDLYVELHAYVRFRLRQKFEQIGENSSIPAHLLGNMWAQTWDNIYEFVIPYPTHPSFDLSTEELTKRFAANASGVVEMFKLANDFYVQSGLADMSMSFGPKASVMKVEGKESICHGSAWDMCDGKDFRINMCSKVDMSTFLTIFHELGHIQYQISYKNQPYTFRGGANPGFHEAIGDLISLSVQTPKYLKSIGLVDENETSYESTINFLMKMALHKVAFLPYGYLMDAYRWKIFDGEISSKNYTYHWLKMRNEIQGVVPPNIRSEDDFDPGAKYHTIASVPYVRYFFSFILQFNLHMKLCLETGQYPRTPLHDCTIYKNKKAGQILKSILEAGRSTNWQELLGQYTGSRDLNANAIKEYFKPLMDFFKHQRSTLNYTKGWDPTEFEKFYKKPEFQPDFLNEIEIDNMMISTLQLGNKTADTFNDKDNDTFILTIGIPIAKNLSLALEYSNFMSNYKMYHNFGLLIGIFCGLLCSFLIIGYLIVLMRVKLTRST